MPHLNNIFERCCHHLLMWVMLLWAITLPGQEEQVYSFMLQGAVGQETTEMLAVSGENARNAVKQKKEQVFPDALTSSYIGLNLQQLFHHPLSRLFLAAPVPATLAVPVESRAGVGILVQLPFLLQPNAP